MTDLKYCATYFRSVYNDRLADIKMRLNLHSKNGEQKIDLEENNVQIDGNECVNAVLMNEILLDKKIPAAKTGVVSGPWEFSEYQSIFKPRTQTKRKSKINYVFYLYDELLKYKLKLCQIVVEKFENSVKNKSIDVYCENDYPCIMVQVKKFSELKDAQTDVQSSLYNIVVAYCAAITNSIALKKNIPIELVLRASFCFNIPSVADTAGSLRISIGLVPQLYATEVLVESLIKLNNDFCVDTCLVTRKLWSKSDFKSYEIDKKNFNILEYNAQNDLSGDNAIAKWNKEDTILKTLIRKGETSGESISQLITRNRANIDLLSDYVHEELIDNQGDFVKPLQRILKHMEWRKSEKKVHMNVNHQEYNSLKRHFPETHKVNDQIQNDDKFWNILERIESVFHEENIDILYDAVRHRILHGLYSLLEKANLEFVRQSANYQDENGYESDSDCEFSIPNDDTFTRTYHANKIIVSTGMRAINLAQYCAIYLTGLNKFDSNHSYYETKEAAEIFYKNNTFKKIDNVERGECHQMDIKTIDLNHCSSAGRGTVVDLHKIKNEIFGFDSKKKRQKIKVIVFDYTTATSDKVREVIQLFAPHVEVLLFVSSGLKNEQLGADMNPYGVIRIFAEKRCMLDGVYLAIKTALRNEFIPQQTQNIRKAYKSIGAALTSEGIFYEIDWKYKKNKQSIPFGIKGDAVEIICKIFTLYCSGKYEEELHRLDRETIISWDIDKIKFLGSKEVHSIVSNKKFNFFDYIHKSYDENPQLTKVIVEKIYNNNMKLNCEKNVREIFSFKGF